MSPIPSKPSYTDYKFTNNCDTNNKYSTCRNSNSSNRLLEEILGFNCDTNNKYSTCRNSFFIKKNISTRNSSNRFLEEIPGFNFDINLQNNKSRKVTQPQNQHQRLLEGLCISFIFMSLLESFINDNSKPSTKKHEGSNFHKKQYDIPKTEYDIPKTKYNTYASDNSFKNEYKSNNTGNSQAKDNNSSYNYDNSSSYTYNLNSNLPSKKLDDALYSALSALSLGNKKIEDLSEKEINSAYRKAARKYHPDKNPSSIAKEKFLKLPEHKELLLDYIKNK